MKKRILLLGTLFVTSAAMYAQSGNVGINTTTPGTTLDVNGAITNRETGVAVTGNAATVPANISQVRLSGAATASVAIAAPAAPNAGQRLIIYNNTTGGFGATLNGFTIANGQAMEFTYSNGGWRATNGGASVASNDWAILGNTGTNPATNFLGTTDNQALAFRTNNTEKARILGNGNVGIGTTTPNSKLDLGTDVTSSKLAIYNDAAGTDFYGFGLSGGLLHFHAAAATPTTQPDMVLHSTGQLGINIGATNPTANLDVNGTARIRTTTPAIPDGTVASPLYVDPTGNVRKVSPTGDTDNYSNTASIAPGATAVVVGGIPDNAAFRGTVLVGNGCGNVAITEFWVFAQNTNNFNALQGRDGAINSSGTASPTFTETQTSSTVVWTGAPSCSDGSNSASLNFKDEIDNALPHNIRVTNNGNTAKTYRVTLVRVGF